MKSALIAIVFLGAASLAACKKSSPAPQQPTPPVEVTSPTEPDPPPDRGANMTDAQLDAIMAELAGFMEKMAVAIEGSQGDCPKMAANIDRVSKEHADLMERTKQLNDPSLEDRADKWMEANGQRINELARRVVEGAGTCSDDAAVQAAMERVGS